MTNITTIAVAISLLFLAACTFADDPSPNELLEKVAAKYKDLKTYKATGTITSDMDSGGMKVKTEVSFSMLLKKPNQYLISWTQRNMFMPGFEQSGAVWSDGKQPYLFMGPTKSYSKMESDQMALAAATGVSGGAAFTIPALFQSGRDGLADPFSRLQNRKIEGSEKVDGDDCYILNCSSAVSNDETFSISKTSFLIRKYERSLDPPEGGLKVPEMTDEQLEQIIESSGQEVTEEAKQALRKTMKESLSRLKNMKISGTTTEVHANVSTPELDKGDFKFDLPDGTVLKDSPFGGLLKRSGESGSEQESAMTKSESKSTSLFNGKDLSGWHVDVPHLDKNPGADPTFIVRDGLLISLGKPTGHLITDAQYEDYRLEVEYRFAGKPGNCGVLVHASTPRALYKMFPKSIECQMNHQHAGDFWCIVEDITVPDMVKRRGPKENWGITEGKGRRILNLTDDSEKPVGQWNTMVIECYKDAVKVWVNGDLVNHGTRCSATKGQIALQAEGSEVEFRKLELSPIKKLSE